MKYTNNFKTTKWTLNSCCLYLLVLMLNLSACTEPNPAQQQANAYKGAITTLLKQDADVAKLYPGDKTSISEEMHKLDMSQCPQDFSVAYLDHIHAWSDAAEIQRGLKALHDNVDITEVMTKTLIQKLFGSKESALDDAVDAENTLKAAAQQADMRIKETFRDVERIAVAYGATLP